MIKLEYFNSKEWIYIGSFVNEKMIWMSLGDDCINYRTINDKTGEVLTDKREKTGISKVFMICNTYESGVGHGFEKDGLPNPYKPDTDEYEAYDIGYKEGIYKRKEMEEK